MLDAASSNKCIMEEESRMRLKEDLEEIWMSSKLEGGLTFDLKLILAPFFIKKLNLELSGRILDEVFKFFEKMSRNF